MTSDVTTDPPPQAYKTLPKAAATRLLLLGDDQDIATFASEREWSQTAGSLSFPEVQ